jgi:hypothetical protein
VLSRQFEFTINPQDTCPMAAVLDRVGAIKTRPASWKIIFSRTPACLRALISMGASPLSLDKKQLCR